MAFSLNSESCFSEQAKLYLDHELITNNWLFLKNKIPKDRVFISVATTTVKITLSFGHQTLLHFASVYLAWVPSDLVFNSTLRESIK